MSKDKDISYRDAGRPWPSVSRFHRANALLAIVSLK